MEKKDLRIVYMGTPEFAVESLKRLVEGGYNVVAVITMPDKPMGRHGSVLQASPVKQYAVSQGLKVLQPERLKDEAFVEELRALKADLQIVVAFRMLPEVVWNMPPMGTFNLLRNPPTSVGRYLIFLTWKGSPYTCHLHLPLVGSKLWSYQTYASLPP